MSDEYLDVPEPEAPVRNAYEDPSSTFPRQKYINVASTNQAARGLELNEVYTMGGGYNLNLELKDLNISQYPLNQVRETVTGHIQEIDDTPGRERMLFKHRTGTGIDMRPDGTIIISSKHNKIEITGGDQKVIVSGDGEVVYEGNLKLTVNGDMDVEVGGDYNLRVHGDKREDIRGNSETRVVENHETVVVGNKSNFISGTNTDTILTDNNFVVKGDDISRVEGKIHAFSGDEMILTAEEDLNLTSPSINIGAQDLSVISKTGIIGGRTVFYYGMNYYGTSATFTEGVTAPTFHGSLQGNALTATQAGRAGTAGALGASGSAGSHTNTATNTAVRTNIPAPGPTSGGIDEYVEKSDLGRRQISVDVGNAIRDAIDKSSDYGGISKSTLTVAGVRSKLRDPNTVRNEDFIGRAMSEGILSASYVQQKPEAKLIGRISNKDGSPRIASGRIFPGGTATTRTKFSNNNIVTETIIPNQLYNPELQFQTDGEITGKTKLGPGISLAKFLGGYGDPETLNHVTDDIERLRIARNLYLHAELMKSVNSYLEKDNRFRLMVVEGFYKKNDNETLEVDSLNYLQTRGQVVIYELRDQAGQIAVDKTYDVAEYIKDYLRYEKMILDYDTYDPNGELNAQIIVVMPDLGPTFEARYMNNVETRYNNYTQTNGELVEILE